MGVKSLLISGDAPAVTREIARQAGIEEAHGAVLADEKADWVKRLKEQRYTVAMTGDGVATETANRDKAIDSVTFKPEYIQEAGTRSL
jgi:cation transport ATPase